jgi:hypothetical protein
MEPKRTSQGSLYRWSGLESRINFRFLQIHQTEMLTFGYFFYEVALLRKEVIQPQVLLQLPCYDFTPITKFTIET